MARSVFYYHLKRLKTIDKYSNEKESIKLIFHEHKGRYGYRRVTAEMHNRGFMLNHKTIQRLMGDLGLKSKIRMVRYRSYKGEVGKIAPNIIDRDFTAEAPNRKWATDVTQIKIGSVKLYLSPILDMFNGEIISYNISRNRIWNRYTICWIKRSQGLTVLTDLYSILIKDGNTNTTVTVNVLKNII